jgi:hypothetical protein
MSAKSQRKVVILAVLSLALSVHCVHADKSQLQQRLDKPIAIKLTDVTIAEALEKIGQKAELKIVLSEEAIWKLPQGEATKLSVALDGPLAESLTEMLNAFFMRYAVGEERITVYPRPELQHILGRPSHKQLELLKKMYTTVLVVRARSPEIIKGLICESFQAVIFPVDCYSALTRVMTTLVEGLPADASSPQMQLAPLLDSMGRTWYVSGPDFANQFAEIWCVGESDFREAKLNQIVDISFKDEPAEVIIHRLANWTGMELRVYKNELSWLDEKISVDMQNVTLKQALRNVVSTVDGDVDIDATRNSIQVKGPLHTRQSAAPKASKSGEYVGKMSIPMHGGKYFIEFMLRESDLTEELKKLRADKIKEILGEPAEEPNED